MSLYILDTDSLTLYQHGNAAIHSRIQLLAPNELAVTVISVEEQIVGRLARLRRAQPPDQLARSYRSLADSVSMLSRLAILSFTEQAIARYDQLVALKLKVGRMDLRIAAVTLEHGAILVTRNLKDFQRIPNLIVENWAV